MSTATDLARLGWRTDSGRLRQAISDFQRGWNLGPALTVDGKDGPATRAAIALSARRLDAGLPTASAKFSFSEFACNCNGKWPDCRRIWQERESIQSLEAYRAEVGPLNIERGCRCPRENARVGGVSNSQHLYGRAADVSVFEYPVEKVYALRVFTGVGYYVWKSRAYPRHLDVRTNRTVTSPAKWNYGTAKSTPLPPRPDLAKTPTTQENEDMAVTEDDLKKIANAVWGRAPWGTTTVAGGVPGSSAANNLGWQSAWAYQTLEIVKKLAAQTGVDIDEAALSKALVAELTPVISQAATTAAKSMGVPDPSAYAKAVVAELGTALTPTKETTP